MYYRVAIHVDQVPHWQWRSTALSEFSALFQLLRLYRALPQDHLRVFSSSSREELDELLARENNGDGSGSATAAQFLQERRIGGRAMTQGAAEPRQHGTGEDQVLSSIAVSTQAASNAISLREPPRAEGSLSALERRRLELERGAGGDNDRPYTFTLPACMPQVLAWVRLLMRVRNGALSP